MSKNIQKTAKCAKKGNADSRHRVRTIILSVVVGLFLIYDLSGFGGNMQFYTTWVFCGQKPVRTYESGLFNADTPRYVYPPSFTLKPRMANWYYCSPLDAERAGYSASIEQYEFPHLRAAGEFGRGIDREKINKEQNDRLKGALFRISLITATAMGVGKLYYVKKHSKNR